MIQLQSLDTKPSGRHGVRLSMLVEEKPHLSNIITEGGPPETRMLETCTAGSLYRGWKGLGLSVYGES